MEKIANCDNGAKRSGLGDSTSEPNLATGERELWFTGFPPGFNVDDLRWYRKKRPPVEWAPKDNLRLETGSMSRYKTEYARRFKKFEFLPASSEDLTDSNNPQVRRRRRRRKPLDSEDWLGSKENVMDYKSEHHDKFVPLGGALPAQLIRRSTSLQREGEFMVKSSETHSNYKKYDDAHRSELFRRPTSLKLEGDMNTTTETAEKFMEMLINQRAELAKATSSLQLAEKNDISTDKLQRFESMRQPLSRRSTNLQPEGKMHTQTEKQEKYIPFNLEDRPSPMKRTAHLKLEGDFLGETENRQKYAPLDGQRQPMLKRPTNLHLEGDMETRTESGSKFVPQDTKRPPLAKKDTNLRLEGDLNMTPMYKDAYVPLPTDSMARKARRPLDNLQGSEYGSDRDESPEKIFKSEMHMVPLYKESYRPYNIEKQTMNKPKQSLKQEGDLYLATESQEIGRMKFDSDKTKTKDKDEDKPDISIKEIKEKSSKVKNGSDVITAATTSVRAGSLKTEGQNESKYEYRSSLFDLPTSHSQRAEKSVIRKTSTSLKPTSRPVSRMASSPRDMEAPQITYRSPSPGSVVSLKKKDQHSAQSQEFGQRFECQPEYRKAYVAYLTRENINRLPRAFANFEEQTPTVESPDLEYPEPEPEPVEPPRRPKYKSPYAAPKIPFPSRDLRVPRTPKQETYLVPDLSGNTVRRASSIFGPNPLRKSISRPESPVGNFHIMLPPPPIEIPQSPKRKRSKAKPAEKVQTSRDRSAPSSPCHKHRSPSGKPLQRRHSPCERLSRQASLSSLDRKPPKSSSRKENIPIHLQPPTPKKEKPSISARTYKISSTEKVPKAPSRKGSKDESRSSDSVASFVVLHDNEDINNNQTKKVEKERRWMPSWYEKFGK